MDKNSIENETQEEVQTYDRDPEIANMDAYDFIELLMESRIIWAHKNRVKSPCESPYS